MGFCTKCHSCWICLEYHQGDSHEGAGCKTLSYFHRSTAGKGKPDRLHRIDVPHGGFVNLGQASRTWDQNHEL
jgi:hypothetical protein